MDIEHTPEGVYVQWMAESGSPDFFFLYGQDLREVGGLRQLLGAELCPLYVAHGIWPIATPGAGAQGFGSAPVKACQVVEERSRDYVVWVGFGQGFVW